MASRKLNAAERAFAYRVFAGSVRYDAVSISDTAIDGQVITTHFNACFHHPLVYRLSRHLQ